MSVRGLGIDLVSIPRMAALLERHGARFRARVFRPGELAKGTVEEAAGRWAAKEAFLKALGADIRHIPYRDVEVVRGPSGPVSLRLHGVAAETLQASGGGRLHLTISHERDHALAMVLVES